MSKPRLLVDFCSAKAAMFACERWHYTGSYPMSTKVYIGAWEGERYIGAVVFAKGANRHMHMPFGVQEHEVAELCRVAFRSHEHPVSKSVSYACKLLHRHSPGLRVLVSYADPVQGHHGGIYQAMNWTYLGLTEESFEYRVGTKRLHKRAYTGRNFHGKRRPLPPGAERVIVPGKHRYALGLDREMRQWLSERGQPYPKRT